MVARPLEGAVLACGTRNKSARVLLQERRGGRDRPMTDVAHTGDATTPSTRWYSCIAVSGSRRWIRTELANRASNDGSAKGRGDALPTRTRTLRTPRLAAISRAGTSGRGSWLTPTASPPPPAAARSRMIDPGSPPTASRRMAGWRWDRMKLAVSAAVRRAKRGYSSAAASRLDVSRRAVGAGCEVSSFAGCSRLVK